MSNPPTTIYMPNDLEDEVEPITLPAQRVYYTSNLREIGRQLLFRIAEKLLANNYIHVYTYGCSSLAAQRISNLHGLLSALNGVRAFEEAVFLIYNFCEEYRQIQGSSNRTRIAQNIFQVIKKHARLSVFFFEEKKDAFSDQLYQTGKLIERYSDRIWLQYLRNDSVFNRTEFVPPDESLVKARLMCAKPNPFYYATLFYVSRACTLPAPLTQAIEQYPGDLYSYLVLVWIDLFEKMHGHYSFTSDTHRLVEAYLDGHRVSPALRGLMTESPPSLENCPFTEVRMFSQPQFLAVLKPEEAQALLKNCDREKAYEHARSNQRAWSLLEGLLQQRPPQ